VKLNAAPHVLSGYIALGRREKGCFLIHLFLSHCGYSTEKTLPVYCFACEFVETEFKCQVATLDELLSITDSPAYVMQALDDSLLNQLRAIYV